jgi:hypothetical protein
MGVDSAQIEKWEPDVYSRLLEEIRVRLEDRLLEPPPIQTFTFENFQGAFQVMSSRSALGKVVVEMT